MFSDEDERILDIGKGSSEYVWNHGKGGCADADRYYFEKIKYDW